MTGLTNVYKFRNKDGHNPCYVFFLKITQLLTTYIELGNCTFLIRVGRENNSDFYSTLV